MLLEVCATRNGLSGPLNWWNEVSRHSQVTETVHELLSPMRIIKTSGAAFASRYQVLRLGPLLSVMRIGERARIIRVC